MDVGAEQYKRYLAGDDDGLRSLIELYRLPLELFLRTLTNDAALAEDCAQETFLRLAVKRPHFGGKSTFKTFLFRIGRNAAIDCLRRQKHEIVTDDVPPAAPLRDDTPEALYLQKEAYRKLYLAMERLRPAYRQILFLRYFEDLSLKDCAKVLKKSTHAAEMTLHRARAALKEALGKEGLFDEIQ